MTFALSTLNKRKPLWLALSDLFLDTELQKCDLTCIAKAMKASSYSLDEIENILMTEVFSVCIVNLKSPVGEWDGMDEAWLCRSIAKARRPNRFSLWRNKRSFWMIKEDWETVVNIYKSL